MNRFLEIDQDLSYYKKNQRSVLSQSKSYAYQKNPGAVAVAGATLAYKIVKDTVFSEGDISWEFERMKNYFHPWDKHTNYKYSSKSPWEDKTIKVKHKKTNRAGDDISLGVDVSFQFNGYSIGNINLKAIKPNDAWGHGLKVTGTIMPDNNVHQRGGNKEVAAMKVNLEYHFKRPIYSDKVDHVELILFGNGTWRRYLNGSIVGVSA
ncbi:MAG: hypothetical protein AAF806_07725 [Bacteroidota bacterium]